MPQKKKEKKHPTRQEIAKAATSLDILKVLRDSGGKLRWKDLKNNINQRWLGLDRKISPRTLTGRLKDLMEAGYVRRIVDASTYPPTVFYEISSKASEIELPGSLWFETMYRMVTERERTHKLFRFLSKDPEHLVETMFNQYQHDLLFTLKQCIDARADDSSRAHFSLHWIRYHIQWYETALLELARLAKKDPKIKVAIQRRYEGYEKAWQKEKQERLKDLILPFKDQELAKPLMEQFSVMFVLGDVSTASAFLRELMGDEELRSKVEQRFNKPIDNVRLEAVVTDPAWKKIDDELKREN